MTNIISDCNHSKMNIYCDTCLKLTEENNNFKNAKNELLYNCINLDVFGYGKDRILTDDMDEINDENKKSKKISRKKIEIENQKTEEIRERENIAIYIKIADLVLNELKRTNKKETDSDFDEIIRRIIDTSGYARVLHTPDFFLIKNIIMQKFKGNHVKSYMERIADVSSSFKNYINDNEYKFDNNELIYNIGKLQSKVFRDMSAVEKQVRLLTYSNFGDTGGKFKNIHPLLVALFGCKILALDYHVIYGKTIRLINFLIAHKKNISNMLSSTPYEFHLLLNKMTYYDINKYYELPNSEFEQLELEKIKFHENLRYDIINIRSGNFAFQNIKNPHIFVENPETAFLDHIFKMLDISQIIYKQKNFSYIKIKLEVSNAIKTLLNIETSNFIDNTNNNILELIQNDPRNSSNGMQFNDFSAQLVNNGFLVFQVDRSLTSMSYLPHINPDAFYSTSLLRKIEINTKQIKMPDIISLQRSGHAHKLRSVLGYIMIDGKKYDGLYYTVIFTDDNRMWYYSNDYGILTSKLKDFQEGSDIINDNTEIKQHAFYSTNSFLVREDRQSDILNMIYTTGIIYVYDSAEHTFSIDYNA